MDIIMDILKISLNSLKVTFNLVKSVKSDNVQILTVLKLTESLDHSKPLGSLADGDQQRLFKMFIALVVRQT